MASTPAPAPVVICMLEIFCPYAEKDDAKRLGAKWSSGMRTWYAPTPEVYHKLVKWHKPRPKPASAIAKKKTTDLAKYPKELVHQEPELHSAPGVASAWW